MSSDFLQIRQIIRKNQLNTKCTKGHKGFFAFPWFSFVNFVSFVFKALDRYLHFRLLKSFFHLSGSGIYTVITVIRFSAGFSEVTT